ncbi:MAG TPA: carboxyltransferase domain-containing protein, partial [Kineosporiaceae bacterium]|nr:carboxyltransferase domain-containing protein [Kineosporiaceae bacterium]
MRLLPIGDLVPAERTTLIRFDPRSVECDAVAAWVHRAMSTAAPAGRPSGADVAGPDVAGPDLAGPDVAGPDVAVRVIVRYDGDDLDDVGRLTGLGPAGVIAVDTGTVWTVAFTGFAPGFGYLVGGDPRLRVPRLPVPRVRVPAGAVALAGDYSGVYPRASPGGWRLIGRTDTPIWDLRRDPPALLRPGVRVQFVDAGRLVANPESAAG